MGHGPTVLTEGFVQMRCAKHCGSDAAAQGSGAAGRRPRPHPWLCAGEAGAGFPAIPSLPRGGADELTVSGGRRGLQSTEVHRRATAEAPADQAGGTCECIPCAQEKRGGRSRQGRGKCQRREGQAARQAGRTACRKCRHSKEYWGDLRERRWAEQGSFWGGCSSLQEVSCLLCGAELGQSCSLGRGKPTRSHEPPGPAPCIPRGAPSSPAARVTPPSQTHTLPEPVGRAGPSLPASPMVRRFWQSPRGATERAEEKRVSPPTPAAW